MSIWDHLPKHHSELLLKYDEYVGTWAELVESLYGETCGREKVRAVLGQGGERADALSTAIIVALLSDGLRAWKAKPRLRAKLLCEVEDSIVSASLKRIVDDDDAVVAIRDVYYQVFDTFRRAFPLKQNETQHDTFARCAAMAAYAADRISDKDDAGYQDLVQEIAIALAEADQIFTRLGLSTTVDGNTLFMKHPRFIVLKS